MADARVRTRGATGAALVLLVFSTLIQVAGQAGESGVSGIWQGTVTFPGAGDQQLKITANQRGGSFGGMVSIPGDNLNFTIDRGEYGADEGFLLLSGVSAVTIPDGSTPRMRFVFQGFLEDNERAWDGYWYMTPENNEEQLLVSDSFSLKKSGRAGNSGNTDSTPAGGGQNKPSSGGSGTPKGGTSGLITVPAGKAGTGRAKETGGEIARPEGQKDDGGDMAAPDMSGTWKGEAADGSSTGTTLMTLTRSGGSYSGNIVSTDEAGEETRMTVESGVVRNGRFEVAGTMSVFDPDEGEEYVFDVAASGPVKGDVWNAVVTAKYEGQVVVSTKVRMTRLESGAGKPKELGKPDPASKSGGMSGKGKADPEPVEPRKGGGMSGKGKQ